MRAEEEKQEPVVGRARPRRRARPHTQVQSRLSDSEVATTDEQQEEEGGSAAEQDTSCPKNPRGRRSTSEAESEGPPLDTSLEFSGSTAMTSQHLNHAEMVPPTVPPAPPVVPKLHVQRSLSRETITIHFSPLGKEDDDDDDDYDDDDDDDDEKELYGETSATAAQDDSNVMTALEASEEMVEGMVAEAGTEAAVIPESSTALSPVPNHQSTSSRTSSPPLLLAEKKVSNSNSSPTKSLSLPSMDKPSVSITKSLSTDTEPRESVSPPAPPLVRHRLMKTLVKSLSSDTSQDSSSSTSLPYRLSDSRLNLQLFKQFTQSRMPTVTVASVGDFKTAPPSPLTSPDSRYFFKVSEVEARIEDTKRRLSEVICEPLQMLSKIMDEKSGGVVGGGSICRPKALSSSASELSSLASFSSSDMESNNNTYSIREEEAGEWEFESPKSRASSQAESPGPSWADAKSPSKSLLGSVSLDKCSMSALAKQENEDFCILSSEDFETCSETEANGADKSHNGSGTLTKPPPSSSTEPFSEDEADCESPASSVPIYTLICLTVLVYGYFLLPLPTYIGGMCLGAVLGFFLTLGVVWLAGPKPSECIFRHSQHHGKPLNLAHLSITEPVLFKGWMNEIVNYDPENYYATLTHSVYVRLEGSILRLSKPNRNIARRATHNEPKPDNIFISQKIYDLTDSKVYLVPPNLAKKRVWNKKYPICVELGKQDDFMSKAEGDRVDEERTAVSGDKGTGTGATQGKGRSSSSYRDVTLYLFGRTGREKEEWFQRILLASKRKSEMKRATSLVGSKNALSSHSRSSSRGSLDEALASPQRLKDSQASSTAVPGIAKAKPLLDYSVYMAALVPAQPAGADPVCSALQSPHSSPEAAKKLPSTHPSLPTGEEEPVAWLNALLGRVLWDFLGEPHWAELVSNKIQMKLSKIRLPYFMNELTLTELDMGVATPRILGASRPSVDHKGLWFDLDISYSSSFLMTLETKMNLIRLRKEGEAPRTGEPGRDGYRPRTYCLADSDEESSSAGSSDEEDTSETTADSAGAEGHVGGHKPSKMMRFVDKITKSKYFQKATETEFIKKKMEEVSNTPLLLTVEVQELQGTLAVNIPPPPTDRIWYGFRTPPHLELKARPKLGEREVTLAHVTDWIEKKLNQEFQKIFVMPNMDDLWLSVMHSAMDPRSHGGPLACSASGLDASPQAKGAADRQ